MRASPTTQLVARAILMLSLMLSATSALAQGAPASAAAKKGVGAPRKVLRLEEMKVEGRIQKPQAIFLMPRSNLNYGDLDRAEPFLHKVTKAVEKDPF